MLVTLSLEQLASLGPPLPKQVGLDQSHLCFLVSSMMPLPTIKQV